MCHSKMSLLSIKWTRQPWHSPFKNFYPEFNFNLTYNILILPKFTFLFWISFHSYCSKFPSSGTGSAIPVCRTEEVWSENEVEFMSTLYLPRNSPVYWPVQVSDEKNYMYFKILKIIPSNSKHKMCSSRKYSYPPCRGERKFWGKEGSERRQFSRGSGAWLFESFASKIGELLLFGSTITIQYLFINSPRGAFQN